MLDSSVVLEEVQAVIIEKMHIAADMTSIEKVIREDKSGWKADLQKRLLSACASRLITLEIAKVQLLEFVKDINTRNNS